VNNKELTKKVSVYAKELIEEQGYISSIDILLKLGYLSKEDLKRWRFGEVEYLEKVCQVNLRKLSTVNKTIRQLSVKWNLKNSWTGYNSHGKSPKRKLQFSKSNNKNIEEAYATHFLKR